MMEPIILAEIAQDLNSKLQKIDPRLFFFCNYAPSPVPVMSDDAWFVTAVQDLFKFAFDSTFFFNSYVSKECFDECDECIYKDYKGTEYRSIKPLLETVSTLRSVIDHNQSDDNGLYEKLYLKKYDAWIKSHSTKEKLEDPEDYKPLNDELKNIAKALINAAEKFIVNKSKCSEAEKATFVDEIIQNTITWYSKGVKTIIYKGMVADFYNIRSKKAEEINAYLNKIFRIYCLYSNYRNDVHITECSKIVFCCNNARSFGINLSKEAIAKESDAKNALAQAESSYTPSRNWWHHFESEFLSTVLKSTRERLDKENVEYTLLPESFIDKNIGEIFKNIEENTQWEYLVAKEKQNDQ